MFALLIAGGSGTRLYPLSRSQKPKQFHSLVGGDSLLEKTVSRLSPLILPGNVWVVTNKDHVKQVSDAIPDVPDDQIISEPFPLGTCLAVGLGLINIVSHDSDAVVAVGWADAYVGSEEVFRKALSNAAKIAPDVGGVILGAKPTFPSTEYGYIKKGEALSLDDRFSQIERFEEKPNLTIAKEFCDEGNYFWNTGITVWKARSLLKLLETFVPAHYSALISIEECFSDPNFNNIVNEKFRELDKVTIDNAIFEKARDLVVLPVDMEWSDIGSWSALYKLGKKNADKNENVIKGKVVSIDTNDSLIYSQKRLIATMGVSDLVIVETDDVLLVMSKAESQKIKRLHNAIEKDYGKKYL